MGLLDIAKEASIETEDEVRAIILNMVCHQTACGPAADAAAVPRRQSHVREERKDAPRAAQAAGE